MHRTLTAPFAIIPALLLSAHFTAADAQTNTQPNATAFVHVNVVPMDRDGVVRNQTVLIEGNRITAIGSRVALPKDARIVNGHGTQFIAPGLADMHEHSGIRNDLVVYLAHGVTTVLNMGEAGNGYIGRTRPAVNRGEIPGPHVYGSFRVDGSPRYGSFVVTTGEEARSIVRLARANGYDFIKVYNDLSAECFDSLIAEGRARQVPIIGHGVTQVGLERQLRAGQVLVAHAEEFFYTFFTEPGDEQSHKPPDVARIPAAIDLIKQTGTFVTADLNTYGTIARQWGKPAVVDEFMRMPEVRYLAPSDRLSWRKDNSYVTRPGDLSDNLAFLKVFIKAMSDAGVPLVTGTDSPAIPGLVPGLSLHQDLRALEQAGLTRYQVLAAATRTPGEFIRKSLPGGDTFGTIAVGSRADIVLTAGNPLDDLATLQRPLGVMAHGKWYTAAELQAMLVGIAKEYEEAATP